MRRREFLGSSAGLAAASLAGAASGLVAPAVSLAEKPKSGVKSAESAMSLPIIDTHQHLWDLSKFKLPWQAEEPTLAKNFLPADYLAAIAGQNVVQSVYMEVDVEVSQQHAEAEYVLELCARDDNPMTAAVISGRPAADDFVSYMKRYEKNDRIKGIRQVLHGASTPPGYCTAPAFVRGIQHLGTIGKSFDLCMRSDDMGDAVKLATLCPETRFIMDHCGNMSVTETKPAPRKIWLDGMKALAERPNVVCKVSGIIASASVKWTPQEMAPVVLDTIKAFGIDRVMFAADWPVCTLRAQFGQWVDCLNEIVKDFSEADRRKLFHDNAKAFYALPDKKWKA
jgi:L-fuconolactonase